MTVRNMGLFALVTLLSGCSGIVPERWDPLAEGLPTCGAALNCVHTGEQHPEGTAPFVLDEAGAEYTPGALYQILDEVLEELPRTRIIDVELASGLYIRAESVSRIFRFVDDVEFRWRVGSPELELRSASRIGRGDRGVNSARVEALREALRQRGVVR